jgi:uncharacterized peroxidase-related enzyme
MGIYAELQESESSPPHGSNNSGIEYKLKTMHTDKETNCMHYSTMSDLPMIEEEEATDEVARIYAEVKRDLQLPIVPNAMKVLAVSPAALAMYWDFTRSTSQHATLPQSLTSMILYTIAKTGGCEYCSAAHELTCRTLGVDEETLGALVEDLDNVSPQRIRVIIEFALKAAQNPQSLVAEDYERVREQGVTDEELVEIIMVAARGKYLDTLADALKIKVESMVSEALGR